MNALLISRPAKLWAFNIGHPCPSLAKGELLLLSQAQPTIEGSPPPTSPLLLSPPKEYILRSIRRARSVCALYGFAFQVPYRLFCRVRVCVCLYGFASLQNSVHTRLMHPCIACPSRRTDHLHFHKHRQPRTIPIQHKKSGISFHANARLNY